MTSRSGDRRGLLAVAALCLIGCATLLVTTPGTAAHASPAAFASAPSRPPEAVAYARIAVVRVLTYYNGTLGSNPRPIPALSPCAADGVLVGTTGNGLNSLSYVLVPTEAVNPITPCEGVQAVFQQLNGNASGWSISHIDVLLNVAYTGTDSQQVGTIRYSIDPAQISTNGGANAPRLLALALSTPSHAPTHDLPVLSVPQPSDAPAVGTPVVLDLAGYNGQPLGRDSLTGGEVTTTLYPIAVPADELNQAPQPTATKPPTATPPQQTVVGGTAVPPTATLPLPTLPATTPTPLSTLVGLGAPEVDSNGRLIGIVISDSQGNHVLAPLSEVARAIGAVTGKPGQLMTQWQQGLAAYYANPPQYGPAADAFAALATGYPDFGGVGAFRTAAQHQSTTISSLTQVTPVATPGLTGPATQTGNSRLLLLFGVLAVVLLALGLALLLMLRRRRPPVTPGPPPGEALLNLLPPDASLDALDSQVESEPTLKLGVVESTPSVDGLDTAETAKMPAAGVVSARTRTGVALMPHAAGLTDPGVKRASDPNQDNILAVEGIRIIGGRTQPYGLFIVADGMGGHLNGQEASQLAIEIVGTHMLRLLASSQPLDDATLAAQLRESVQQAGAELRRHNLNDRADMGTTMTAALVVDDVAHVVNVGDSRTYLLSPESGLRQITTDHSVVASLVAAGVIRPEDVYSHPRRNQIYRSLGGEGDDAEVDTFEVVLQAGDKLLLCSDGLWEMVRDPQIASILRGAADPRQAVELLVREANTNGGEDNISAIVVRLLEDVPHGAEAGVRVLAAPQSAKIPPLQ